MHHEIPLILLIAYGLLFGLIFGLITKKLKLSPIVGYLLAGVAVGPHTPGFVADAKLAAQLAEIGVILLMFGVGMHFDIAELLRVKGIAIPGALVQSGTAIALSALLAPAFGIPISTSLLIGVAVSVASTVVLLRVLMDANRLHTQEGHTAVGWLIVEDLFTIGALVLLPAIAAGTGKAEGSGLLMAFLKAIGSIVASGLLVLVFGKRLLPRLMNFVARTRSSELFTLCVLVVAMAVAVGSAELFGVSMALGAFLGGLVVAQSDVGHQAGVRLMPFRDVFSVLFFVSVGMLFDPKALVEYPGLTAAVLLIVIVGKPLAALFIVVVLNYPLRTAVTAAVALGQIGEFSFILGDLARSLGYFESHHSSVLVSVAIVSITMNPIVFRLVPAMERGLGRLPGIGPWLRSRGRATELKELAEAPHGEAPEAIVAGYGPVGRAVVRQLKEAGVRTLVVDLNVDTVRALREAGTPAIYGEVETPEILKESGVQEARYFILTVPDPSVRSEAIAAIRAINPKIRLIARSRFQSETPSLEAAGVRAIACEETETAEKLAECVLVELQRVTRSMETVELPPANDLSAAKLP